MKITEELSLKVKEVVSCGLVKGLGIQEPGKMCVEAAVCYAMGLPHNDNPTCVGRAVRSFKIRLNDSNWSSNEARGKGMIKIAIAQLGSEGINQFEFSRLLALKTINILLSDLLDRIGLKDYAEACRKAETLQQAETAARNARTAAYAAANAAANAAAAAAYAAAAADAYAVKDYYLNLSSKVCLDVLIELKSPGAEFLYLVDGE